MASCDGTASRNESGVLVIDLRYGPVRHDWRIFQGESDVRLLHCLWYGNHTKIYKPKLVVRRGPNREVLFQQELEVVSGLQWFDENLDIVFVDLPRDQTKSMLGEYLYYVEADVAYFPGAVCHRVLVVGSLVVTEIRDTV